MRVHRLSSCREWRKSVTSSGKRTLPFTLVRSRSTAVCNVASEVSLLSEFCLASEYILDSLHIRLCLYASLSRMPMGLS